MPAPLSSTVISTQSPAGRIVSTLSQGHGFDLHQSALRKAGNGNRGTRRGHGGEEFTVDDVHLGEIGHVLQKYSRLDHPVQARPVPLVTLLQVIKRLARLTFDVCGNQLAAGRTPPDL